MQDDEGLLERCARIATPLVFEPTKIHYPAWFSLQENMRQAASGNLIVADPLQTSNYWPQRTRASAFASALEPVIASKKICLGYGVL